MARDANFMMARANRIRNYFQKNYYFCKQRDQFYRYLELLDKFVS